MGAGGDAHWQAVVLPQVRPMKPPSWPWWLEMGWWAVVAVLMLGVGASILLAVWR